MAKESNYFYVKTLEVHSICCDFAYCVFHFIITRNDSYDPTWDFVGPFSPYLWAAIGGSIFVLIWIFFIMDLLVRNNPTKFLFTPLKSFWYERLIQNLISISLFEFGTIRIIRTLLSRGGGLTECSSPKPKNRCRRLVLFSCAVQNDEIPGKLQKIGKSD